MIRHATRTVFLAGFLAMSAGANASVSVGPSFISGKQLFDKCAAVYMYQATPNDPRKSMAQVAKEAALVSSATGFCLGFIAAAADMIEAATQNFVCRPVDTKIDKVEELFIAYLNRHWEKGEQAAVGLIGSALGEAFHC